MGGGEDLPEMGGGEDLPDMGGGEDLPDIASSKSRGATYLPRDNADVASDDRPSESGFRLGSLFGGTGWRELFETPAAPTFPSYVSDDMRAAATQEAFLARDGLPARAEAWREEEAAALTEGRQPVKNLKFIYGWTILKACVEKEFRIGAALLQALLLDDDYPFPDECAYGLSSAYFFNGDLKMARHWCEYLLRIRPDSDRAIKLRVLIRGALAHRKSKAVEATAVGGALLVGLAGVALALAAGGSRR
eukprot:CAMPEP_0171727418 /NCGR_PEP_ID=MMETSP0991-20121206/26301_1 /TAXON_ID=483369 /ORGANISM="non described non described, Strain CCMP2098" /LENGTH=247 /DNA_ID=CAMNT_0012321191 /DNA_START=1 /DNA_END=744 /DNA_ORIENTATION=+